MADAPTAVNTPNASISEPAPLWRSTTSTIGRTRGSRYRKAGRMKCRDKKALGSIARASRADQDFRSDCVRSDNPSWRTTGRGLLVGIGIAKQPYTADRHAA